MKIVHQSFLENILKFHNFTGLLWNGKAINIFKHPICDANIWHHKTNVEIQPFWREIGKKWQFKMEMYVLSISPLQWDGRNIKYRNGGNLEKRKIHGGAVMCKC